MSFSDKAKQIIAAVAPTIGTALGGPFGTLAGGLVAKALGNGDAKAVEAAIVSGDPDALLKLKEAEQSFTLQMEQLGIQREQLAYNDTANARAREIALHDNTPKYLAYAVVGFTALIEGYALLHGLPNDIDKVIVGRILGTLDSASVLVLSYYFGTTASSRRKDDALTEIAKMP
jgi:hypothetical protein